MKRILLGLLAALFLTCAHAQVPMTGAGKGAPSVVAVKGYTSLGIGLTSANLPNSANVDSTFTFGAVQVSNRVIAIAFLLDATKTISSVTIDPAGANVAMTATGSTIGSPSGSTIAIYSAAENTLTGSKTIRVVFGTTVPFQRFTSQAWQINNVTSTTPHASSISSAGCTTISATITTAVGDLLFSIANTLSQTAVTYTFATSTELPFEFVADTTNNNVSSADWTVASTTGTFTVAPKAATNTCSIVASWR